MRVRCLRVITVIIFRNLKHKNTPVVNKCATVVSKVLLFTKVCLNYFTVLSKGGMRWKLPAHAASTEAVRQAVDVQLHQLPFVLELL